MSEANSRVIKRYANRKLYDTLESRYVTLEQIAEMIRRGEEVKVVDNNSKEDLTKVTLTQIIFEEEKKQRSFLPLAALRNIIQSGGDSIQGLMSQITESAERVGRVFRHDTEKKDGKGNVEADGEQGAEQGAEPVASGTSDWADPTRLVRDFMESVHGALDDWQKRFDSTIHQAIDTVSPLAPLQKEVQTLQTRLADLEQKLSRLEATAPESVTPES